MNFSRRHDSQYALHNQPSLIRAILQNNYRAVDHLLEHDAESRIITDPSRRTPLHLVASLGHTNLVQLLAKYYSVNHRDNDLFTPLHRACRNNHVHTVQMLLDLGANANVCSRTHLTPMHVCATNNSVECARVLRNYVSNIDVTDSYGATALHYAVYNNHTTMIDFLLSTGAKADVQDKHGQRPIHYAALTDSTQAIRKLVEAGKADLNVRNKDALTPLHYAVAYRNRHAFYELHSLGANLDVQDIQGNTPAHWAAFMGCEEIFDSLIQYGMDIAAPNVQGITPLHCACSTINGFNIAVKIIELGCSNIDEVDKFNKTPLHYAAMRGRERIVSELIRRGANIDHCDFHLETPLHKAAQHCHSKIVELLCQSNAQIDTANKDGFTALHLSVFTQSAQITRTLIAAGANPLLWDSCGRTAHFMAAFKGSLDCFMLLLKSCHYEQALQTEENISKPWKMFVFPELDAFKRSLLHYAAASSVCSLNFFELLFTPKHFFTLTENSFGILNPKLIGAFKSTIHRLDINQRDVFGRTPLHYLLMRSMVIEANMGLLVKKFIEYGAELDIFDNEQRLPFHYAVAKGYSSFLKFLVNPRWFKNRYEYSHYFGGNKCPLSLAAYHGHSLAISKMIRDMDFRNADRAIEIATKRGHWSCVQQLRLVVQRRSTLFPKLAMIAARNGQVTGLRILLTNDNIPVDYDELLFMSALNANGIDCIEFLLELKINLHAKDRHGRNALFYAVLGGCHDTIRLLLRCGFKLVRDTVGKSVFHLIASNGAVQMLELFHTLSKQLGFSDSMCALMITKDDDGFSPVEVAVAKYHQKIIEYYLRHFNPSFAQPMMYFASFVSNLTFLEYILQNEGPALMNGSDAHNRSLLHYCCASKRANHMTILKLLLTHPSLTLNEEVNICDEEGLSPLLICAKVGNTQALEYLMEHTNADLTATDPQKNTVLHLACESGVSHCALMVIRLAEAHHLLEQLLIENRLGQTVFHLAAKSSLSSVVFELAKLGFSMPGEDKLGYTPSMYCARDSEAAYTLYIIEGIIAMDSQLNSNRPSTNLNESFLTDQSDNSTAVNNTTPIIGTESQQLKTLNLRQSLANEWNSLRKSRIKRLSLRQDAANNSDTIDCVDESLIQSQGASSRFENCTEVEIEGASSNGLKPSKNRQQAENLSHVSSSDVAITSTPHKSLYIEDDDDEEEMEHTGCETLVDSDSEMF